MELGHVGTGTIVGIAFALCVSVGLPLLLIALVHKKMHATASTFFIGAATFFVFAMTLEQVLHATVLSLFGETITGNIWLYGLYGGVAAGLFEEAGRYIAMRYFMKSRLSLPNALMYGVGHGGIEAMLIVGLTSVNNLVTAFMINNGGIEGALNLMDEATRAATVEQLSALWTLPAYQFFLGGVERILAIALQMALSVIVYQAVKQGKMVYLLLAFAVHAFVDFVTVVTASYIHVALVELIVAVMAAGAAGLAVLICRRNPETDTY